MEDALNATRAAVEEGIIAGGGSAYIHASKKVAELVESLEGDEKTVFYIKLYLICKLFSKYFFY